jgi:superfamily II DNA or RNA helicase
MYGFTASKDTRHDNDHRRLEGLFGPTIFHLPYAEAQQHNLVVPMVVRWLQYPTNRNLVENYETPTARRRYGIWRNENRNAAIAEAARQFVDEGLQTLIVVETIEAGLYLQQLLPDFKFCYAEGTLDNAEKRGRFIRAGIWHEDDTPLTAMEREQLRLDFQERKFLGAIATGVWSVGVSFDSLNVLIRADGQASETGSIQTPGRVARTFDGKDCGIVVDCVDRFDRQFLNRSNTRRKAYARQGWQQFLDTGEAVDTPF